MVSSSTILVYEIQENLSVGWWIHLNKCHLHLKTVYWTVTQGSHTPSLTMSTINISLYVPIFQILTDLNFICKHVNNLKHIFCRSTTDIYFHRYPVETFFYRQNKTCSRSLLWYSFVVPMVEWVLQPFTVLKYYCITTATLEFGRRLC